MVQILVLGPKHVLFNCWTACHGSQSSQTFHALFLRTTRCGIIMRFNLVAGGFSTSSVSTEVSDGVTHSKVLERQLDCELLPGTKTVSKKNSKNNCEADETTCMCYLLGAKSILFFWNQWMSPFNGQMITGSEGDRALFLAWTYKCLEMSDVQLLGYYTWS